VSVRLTDVSGARCKAPDQRAARSSTWPSPGARSALSRLARPLLCCPSDMSVAHGAHDVLLFFAPDK
jgi:hypothetical protein